jgi:hypothetical protein
MAALAHADSLARTGVAFADTGAAIHQHAEAMKTPTDEELRSGGYRPVSRTVQQQLASSMGDVSAMTRSDVGTQFDALFDVDVASPAGSTLLTAQRPATSSITAVP